MPPTRGHLRIIRRPIEAATKIDRSKGCKLRNVSRLRILSQSITRRGNVVFRRDDAERLDVLADLLRNALHNLRDPVSGQDVGDGWY